MNMFDSSQLDTDQYYDKRILREHYRNHDLVARYWEFGYLGKIWKNRKAVLEIDAEDEQGLDDLMVLMRQYVDDDIAARAQARKNRAPGSTELLNAFVLVFPILSPLEKLLLKTHAQFEEGCVPAAKLQRELKLANESSILEIYSSIGQKLNDEIPYQPKNSKGGDLNLKFILDETEDSSVLKLPADIKSHVLTLE